MGGKDYLAIKKKKIKQMDNMLGNMYDKLTTLKLIIISNIQFLAIISAQIL